MATNHSCFMHRYNGAEYYVIKTKGSNIVLVDIMRNGEPQKIKDTSYYGMNASFFNTKTYEVLNIVYQDGKAVCGGTTNGSGSSLIYWTGSSLRCANNITDGTSSVVPTRRGSWAQGGYGLFLGDPKWKSKFDAQTDSQCLYGETARTALLINSDTNDVYLFMTPTLAVDIYALRDMLLSYTGIDDSTDNGPWDAILLDGGKSAQLRCGEYSASTVPGRAVPQIIALKDKT